jgi:hypothetical protein
VRLCLAHEADGCDECDPILPPPPHDLMLIWETIALFAMWRVAYGYHVSPRALRFQDQDHIASWIEDSLRWWRLRPLASFR